jgi:hypothetical protein
MILVHEACLLQSQWIIQPNISLIISYGKSVELLIELNVRNVIEMLLFRGFEDFIREDVFLSDIERVYFSLKSCKNNVFEVVLAVRNPLVFSIFKLRNLNQFNRALNSEVPKPDGIVLT